MSDPECPSNVAENQIETLESEEDKKHATPTTENVATVKAPLLRVEVLRDDHNNSFSYTSEEEGLSHHEASDDPDRSKDEEEFIAPSDELVDKIINQVEFYFSDANILKDAFLLKHVRRNKQGFVSIKLITSFKKVKSLTKDYRAVAYSLRKSEKLEVNEEGKKVSRKDPLPDYDETTPSRTVVAFHLPMELPTFENVAELFSKCGEVALIRIIRPGKPIPQDIKRYSAKHPEIGTTVSAVVEFEKHESAKLAVEKANNTDDWRRGLRVVLLAPTKKRPEKENSETKDGAANGKEEKDTEKKKKRRAGRKNRKHLHENDDSSCYSSGSELDPPSRPAQSLSPNTIDANKLSPSNSPRTSPNRQRRRLGPHGKSPLADGSPNVSPRPSPRSSPESGRKRYDYSSGGDSTPTSPWVQRRIKAAQEINKSPLAHGSPGVSPLLGRRNPDGVNRGGLLERVLRHPKGPDGTTGFQMGRGKPRAHTIS